MAMDAIDTSNQDIFTPWDIKLSAQYATDFLYSTGTPIGWVKCGLCPNCTELTSQEVLNLRGLFSANTGSLIGSVLRILKSMDVKCTQNSVYGRYRVHSYHCRKSADTFESKRHSNTISSIFYRTHQKSSYKLSTFALLILKMRSR